MKDKDGGGKESGETACPVKEWRIIGIASVTILCHGRLHQLTTGAQIDIGKLHLLILTTTNFIHLNLIQFHTT